jgi:hypothetical protein
MVKNTIGGKKGKMLSKKQHSTNNSSFPVSMDEQEIYVCVMKVFGGGVFEVMDKDGLKYKAYLRGKMRGSNKRHNLVSMNSILLVGIRSDLSDKSSVDILFVYDNHHIQTLSLNSHFPICLLSYIQGITMNGKIQTEMDIDKKRDIDNIFLSFDEHQHQPSDFEQNYKQNTDILHTKNKNNEASLPTDEFDFNLI